MLTASRRNDKHATWQREKTTTRELRRSFFGKWPLTGNHHHLQPPKMSCHAHFQEVDLSPATTTTHNPWNKRNHSFSGVWPFSGNHHHHNPPKTSTTAHFDLYLATTSTHNPQKRALQLVFGRLTSLWQPPPPTTPETSVTACFQGVMTTLWQPQPPEMSVAACFQWVDLFLATTTTHNPQKWALQLVFGRLTSSWQLVFESPVTKTGKKPDLTWTLTQKDRIFPGPEKTATAVWSTVFGQPQRLEDS